jgi:hypothetical protein
MGTTLVEEVEEEEEVEEQEEGEEQVEEGEEARTGNLTGTLRSCRCFARLTGVFPVHL